MEYDDDMTLFIFGIPNVLSGR